MFTFLGQVLGISDPAARLASAGRFIVSKFIVQGLDELDSFAQCLAEKFSGFFVELREVPKTSGPVALSSRIAFMATLTGRLIEASVRIVTRFDELPDHKSGISESFYQLSTHNFLLTRPPLVLTVSRKSPRKSTQQTPATRNLDSQPGAGFIVLANFPVDGRFTPVTSIGGRNI